MKIILEYEIDFGKNETIESTLDYIVREGEFYPTAEEIKEKSQITVIKVNKSMRFEE